MNNVAAGILLWASAAIISLFVGLVESIWRGRLVGPWETVGGKVAIVLGVAFAIATVALGLVTAFALILGVLQ